MENAITKKESQLIDKWIKELTALGYDQEGMISIFRLANKKFNHKLTQDAMNIDCTWDEITPAPTTKKKQYKCPYCSSENIETDFSTGGYCNDCKKAF